MPEPRTLLDKIWDAHTVATLDTGETLLYVDLHLLHEVTSPQAFEGLRQAGRGVRRPDRTVATVDHNVPTTDRSRPIADPVARAQVDALGVNCRTHRIPLFDLHSPDQGIVHVIGPELGLTRPGLIIACGDSHTTTHGAFGALAFGIGTTEVEHVLATQCLVLRKPRLMRIDLAGPPAPGVCTKDIALALMAAIGPGGAVGHVLEFGGPVVGRLTMDERMTLCNMSIEAGARAGMIAPDDRTFAYLRGRRRAPRRAEWLAAVLRWQRLASDPGARYDRAVALDVGDLAPQVTWGTRPDMVASIADVVPDPRTLSDPGARAAAERALAYMGLAPGQPLTGVAVDRVFIGSCTNGRLSDLREAAAVARGHRVAPGVRALVVPGSQHVKAAAEAEGLDEVFRRAGFEWRAPGCSMCLGMNADVLAPGERCASTSNRNFEGRQGAGGRTHLVGPAMAAAAAVRGRLTDVRAWDFKA